MDPHDTRAVDAAITSRRSVRRFLPTPVSREQVTEILDVAARSPSGVNTQPWKVHVLMGEPLRALSDAIIAVFDDPSAAKDHESEFGAYPEQWTSPYVERRRKVGWDLYSLLGIQKGDAARMHAQVRRNYRFFDAPVGMIFVLDRVMLKGSVLDYGMFMQSIMVAARARGLDTCPQAAFGTFHRVITARLGIPPEQIVVCGMALGHADPDAAENTLQTVREPASAFAVFHE